MLKQFIVIISVLFIFPFVKSELYCLDNYYLDAIAFDNTDSNDARIDVYIVVPYELLTFENITDKFVANIDLRIQILDKDKKAIGVQKSQKTVTTDTYNSSQGGKAEFAKFYFRFPVNSGTYTVEAELKDKFSSNSFERQREVTVIDFGKYNFSLSGILLLSQIEEIGSRYKITPYVSDDIGLLDNHFFAFFEIYNKNEPKKIKLAYKLLKNGETISTSKLKEVEVPVGTSQNYLYADISNLSLSGEYILQVIAYEGSAEDLDTNKIIAITQRSVKYVDNGNTYIDNDIDKAIKMLRYVANDKVIEDMENSKTEAIKKEKFNLFWKELDPTPNTKINEAKNEYYERIKYANSQFKSYTEGWLSDMGMVFIVMGPPMQVEKQSTFGNNIEYRLWQYPGNKSFLFADKNGFGNFRLERPYLFNEKYKYKK